MAAAAIDEADSISIRSPLRFTPDNALLDTLPHIIWSDDGNGRVDYVNRRWREATGLPAISTDDNGWLEQIHPDDRHRVSSERQRSRQTGCPQENEIRLRQSDGEYRWSLLRSAPLHDAEGRRSRWFETITDIHRVKVAEQSHAFMARELSHRLKNAFTIVSAIASSTVRTHPEASGFVAEFLDRVAALSRISDLTLEGSGHLHCDTLFALIHSLAVPHVHTQGPKIQLEGDDVTLGRNAITPLALALHEQVTNATKYGALSRPEGVVTIECRRQGETVELIWSEEGGPIVQDPPIHQGFGTSILEQGLGLQIGAIEREWRQQGLRLRLIIPMARLR